MAITTVGGNVSAAQTQANARGILALVGSTVPVLAGCSLPLSGKVEQDVIDRGALIHGASGVEGLILPALPAASDTRSAVDFIIVSLRDAPAKSITLVASGALTNIATVFQAAPDVIEKIDQLVLMGGAFGNPGGNIKPHAEFNINVDPLAARTVFESDVSIVVMPLDITHQTVYDKPIRDRIRNMDHVLGPNLATMLDTCAANYVGFNYEAPLHDPHTVAYLLQPGLYKMKTGRVQVHSEGEFSGKTEFIDDTHGNLQTPVSVDAKGFFELAIDNLRRHCER